MNWKIHTLTGLLALALCVSARPQDAPRSTSGYVGTKCGYESCHPTKPNMLNVHIVAHTHDDVGWLKTVDQYYYGSQTLIQKAGVQYIIDSVVQELLRDPKKRFIYVESAFFFKWWKEQTPELQEQVKQLVSEGRLEFIGGAWSMNDEATTHYQSIIDQFSWGLRLLNDTFGECGRPKIGWQIDPFGHSREMASIFAQMGYDGLFFGRLDYQDKTDRLVEQKAEMIWKASANLGESSHLFTGALYNQYQPPPGFCFDILCADEPIIDGKHSPDNNVNRRVDEFFEYVEHMAEGYRTNNVLITMGEDFHYQNANSWYKNLDKLIKYGNERQANGSDINLIYSTPSCYLKALHNAGITWPTKDDDFFPYGSDPHAYWTGYYTSRPTLKRYERVGNHKLQACKQMTVMSLMSSSTSNQTAEMEGHLSFMRETMGIMQHHDAVTGTEKQKVANDYAKRLSVGIRACEVNTKIALNKIATGEDAPPKENDPKKRDYKFEFKSCDLLNISSCDISEQSNRFILTLYNPLSHSTFEYIRVPVSGHNYEVNDYREVAIESQIVPIPESIRSLKFRNSDAKYELVFMASELPPLGYKSYYITKIPDDGRLEPEVKMVKRSFMTTIGNEYLKLSFDTNGFLAEVDSDGVNRQISQEFLYYEGASGNNFEYRNRSSGAYIFRPNNTVRVVTESPEVKVFRGPLVEEVHQVFNEWITQVVRVYPKENWAEFEWLVGPIPVEDGIGKEVISRFNSDIKSNGMFYTDSNGREMMKRKRNHRDTWNVKLLEEEAGNYYPITTKIALEDDEARMAILVDRAQGGASLSDGSLELMVHRRLLHDDDFGVVEALNETAFGEGLVAIGCHYLFVGSSQNDESPTARARERFTQMQKLLPTAKFFNDAEKFPYDEWRMNYTNIFSGLTLSLPQNINLMTFEPWHENEILIRFEHILEKDEDPEYSKPVTFYLKDVLRQLDLVDIQETTLDGNQWLAESRRMEFQPDPEATEYDTFPKYGKSYGNIRLQSAKRPMMATKYLDEYVPVSNRIRRGNERVQLNKLRSEKLANMKKFVGVNKIDLKDDDDKFIIVMEPMQIRTFVLTLQQKI
ncbi:lysosomal alpha-mannosidase isoform X1 [Episyrphus balteatus]|uniref:lysosomal alpha-mannosidase isoform X1 n=1 Tax=Episyrphus balteatus TaxID=286459 RepID=UPI0024857A3E|nr:lysosomal alpha-mannosidase isoform X1 [Episyrphus balteatus]